MKAVMADWLHGISGSYQHTVINIDVYENVLIRSSMLWLLPCNLL